jgi:hypothetical protein
MEGLRSRLEGSGLLVADGTGGSLEFSAAFGNRFSIRSSTDNSWLGPLAMIEPFSTVPGLPGGASEGLGIVGLTLDVPHGTCAAIRTFYNEFMGCSAHLEGTSCVLSLGTGKQQLTFKEILRGEVLAPYDGHHICVYMTGAAFEESYRKIAERGLIFNNPRFPQFNYDSWEEVLRLGEYRILDIIDPKSGRAVYQLEHEIRTVTHPGFTLNFPLENFSFQQELKGR